MGAAKACPAFLAMFLALGAAAQTTVTTSGGTANTVPVFTGAATLGGSPISISSGNVGIGTATPSALFSVGAGSPFQVNSAGTLNSTSSINLLQYAGNTQLTSPSSNTLNFGPSLTGSFGLVPLRSRIPWRWA